MREGREGDRSGEGEGEGRSCKCQGGSLEESTWKLASDFVTPGILPICAGVIERTWEGWFLAPSCSINKAEGEDESEDEVSVPGGALLPHRVDQARLARVRRPSHHDQQGQRLRAPGEGEGGCIHPHLLREHGGGASLRPAGEALFVEEAGGGLLQLPHRAGEKLTDAHPLSRNGGEEGERRLALLDPAAHLVQLRRRR